ncbi:MAG: pyridoxamine 5'-phosphate oxidase family protein [Alphaproteobacteria bacterium]|nr:pyridoxamine 5'-phosphate oxidase family protein [Alphaproteobacteria bacterium]
MIMPDSTSLPDFAPTARSRVRRLHERGRYDRATVYEILDSALLCHVGYVIDGLPYVTPTLFWREGDRLYWHGSSASRMLRKQSEGIPVCVTVSHIDGLVLARSGFHHSLNYRAVMAFGNAAMVVDDGKKAAGLDAFIERLYPGRNRQIRPISRQELKATTLMSMVIDEVSAKIRAHGPVDDEADYLLDCWAGIVPIEMRLGAAIPDERLKSGIPLLDGLDHLAAGGVLPEILRRLAQHEGE